MDPATNSESDQPIKFDSPQQEAFLNLWRTYDCLKALEDELFSQHGISAQQYNALRLLQSVAPRSMPTLSLGRRLISRAPDTTRMLDRLEQRGWIVRQRLPENRRVVEIAITAAGQKFLVGLDGAVRDMHIRQLGHLDRDSLDLLIQMLKQARQPHENSQRDWLNG